MSKKIQPSFAKGEIGPALYGRVDVAMYEVGLRTALNFIVHPFGGASNRSGFQYIGPVTDHDFPSLLVDFQFKTTDSYVLEFSDEKMRVIRNDAHVTEAAVNISAITQANPGVVTATAHGYSNGDEVFITGVGGMTRLNGNRYIVANVTTNTFELTDQVDGSNTDTTGYGAYTSGGTASRIYTTTSPYAAEDLAELKWVQSADVITLTHRDYPIYELTRFDHDDWRFTQVTFAPSITFPRQLSVSPVTTGTTTYSYKVTTYKDGEESIASIRRLDKAITAITKANPGVVTATAHGFTQGQEIYIEGVTGMTELNGRRFIVGVTTANTFELTDLDSTGYTAYVSGGRAYQTFFTITNGNATANNTITWAAVTGAERYNVYKFSGGAYGLIGTTEGLTFTDSNFAPDTTVSPPRATNPFEDNVNPITASYYEQRRLFGGSNAKPDTTWYTQTGNISNMNASQPIQDDDAFNATLTSRQVNEIRHFIPQTSLLAFTSGAEWRIDSGAADHFSIDTIKQKPQSEWGSSHIRPIVINNTVLFVPETRKLVRTLGYSYTIDRYTGNDATLLAPHLFEFSQMLDWTYAASPDPRIYAVRDDGYICTLTFDQDQEVVAWTRWNTRGFFESVRAIRNPTGVANPEDGVYVVVRRQINGRWVRYIEKLHSRLFQEVEDCFFVDCGLSYDNPVAITDVTGTTTVTVTAPAHGFSNGDQIDFSGIEWNPVIDALDNLTQPKQLNGYRYAIENVTTDTFDLVAADGTGWKPYLQGGYARKAVSTVTGLDHLEGMEVVALADGNVVTDLTVADGAVTFTRPFSRINVGLKYICDMETLNIEASQGTIQGELKKVSFVTVRFQRTRGMWIGHDGSDLTEMKQREYELMGQPTALLTGDKLMYLNPDWNTNGRLLIRQRDPLPITVLAIIPDIEVGS